MPSRVKKSGRKGGQQTLLDLGGSRYRDDDVYRGRFAPSPTGSLHLGSAVAALFAAAAARRAQGQLVLRIEDLDGPRNVEGSEASITADLGWLGIVFDEGPLSGGPSAPYRQSERTGLYEAALDQLARSGHVYLCDCSRREIASIASAPHEGDEGPPYPGTCRSFGMSRRPFKRPPAHRLRVPDRPITYLDSIHGPRSVPRSAISDFVLRRADGVFSYQLATLVDDVTMGITEAVRGADLLGSAPRQALLAELLGARAPAFLHVPLLTEPGGERLAKRRGALSLGRDRGVDPRDLIGRIAAAYGHPLQGRAGTLSDLAEKFDPARFPGESVSVGLLSAESIS